MTPEEIIEWAKKEELITETCERLDDACRAEDGRAVEVAVQALRDLDCDVEMTAAGWTVTSPPRASSAYGSASPKCP